MKRNLIDEAACKAQAAKKVKTEKKQILKDLETKRCLNIMETSLKPWKKRWRILTVKTFKKQRMVRNLFLKDKKRIRIADREEDSGTW